MTTTPDSLRRDLANNAAAASAAGRSAAEIRKAAEERREAVQRRLDQLRASALGAGGDEYPQLVRERGELDLVLARGGVDE